MANDVKNFFGNERNQKQNSASWCARILKTNSFRSFFVAQVNEVYVFLLPN